MRDVARRAGVSHQTVSRVINGPPSLRAATRDRVLAAMDELSFRPNRAARALVTSRSTTIGVLVSKGFEYGPAASLQAIDSAAREAGYGVDVAHLDDVDTSSIRSALDRLLAHGVDGIIILAPQTRTLGEIEHLSITLPFVTVHSARADDDHRLSVDQSGGAALATRHLLRLGHRRIVHVAGPDGWFETAARIRGYRGEMESWGLEPEPLLSGNWTAASGYEAGHLILRDPGITAVFSSNDQMALGLLHAFREQGLRVPEDLSVVGFDDVPESPHYWPPLTTVRQNFPELGRRCVARLLALIGESGPAVDRDAGEAAGAARIPGSGTAGVADAAGPAADVAPELVPRESTAPPRRVHSRPDAASGAAPAETPPLR
ncbi:LacI family DNA-binding transcriptional regulator [Arthrobacter agilis]|nr:LacI family transcriptional regulator [Arthrobacter agilis]PPB46851.1 LacI family DNA-binding transcriptional regulator [Arthrobacter agilis]TPV25033.1 LacI family DNA-binding transcriptional regulator [Arthrobacter agilis]